jgi:hypothetical protein
MPDPELIEPSEETVGNACRAFDGDDAATEMAVGSVFEAHPTNRVDWGVLLKVAILDRLYSTNLYDVRGMAVRICGIGEDIDAGLAAGSPDTVDRIAGLGQRKAWSFASKYCSWHRQDAYPIWDSRVKRYLQRLRQKTHLEFLGTNPDLWNRYAEFVKMISDLRNHYMLGAISFKDIDKFLYIHGREEDVVAKAAASRRS